MLHEILRKKIIICGAGTIGSSLCCLLARQNYENLVIIDGGTVLPYDASNLNVAPKVDAHKFKVTALQMNLTKSSNTDLIYIPVYIEQKNMDKFLSRSSLVINTTNNREFTRDLIPYCAEKKINCLNIELNDDICDILWNRMEEISDVTPPLSLKLLAIPIVYEVVLDYLRNKKLRNFRINGFNIKEIE